MTYTIYHGGKRPMRAVGEHQCRLLMFAERFQCWHTFRNDYVTRRAVKRLQEKGCLTVEDDQFRFTYPNN